MFALMMLMGLATSCNSKSDANNAGAETTEAATEEVRPLADLLKDAKENGANWSVDEWKAAYREMAINVKPAMIEWKTVTEMESGLAMAFPDGEKYELIYPEVRIPQSAFNTDPKPENYEVRLESTIGIYGTGLLDALDDEEIEQQWAAEAPY